MKKKPRARSKAHGEKRGRAEKPSMSRAQKAPLAAPPLSQPAAAAAPTSEPVGEATQKGAGFAARLLLPGVLLVFGVLMCLLLAQRWQVAAGTWPTRQDVGLWASVGVGGASLLVAASLLAWLARLAAQAGRTSVARLSLFVAVLLASLVLGLRGLEYRALYRSALWRPGASGLIYDEADIYYVQAVRLRLQELFTRLDDRRVNRPDQFSDQDQQKLDLVASLQTNMIEWTQQQVGHWLEDVQQRRQLMAIVAFQVHPSGRDENTVADFVRQQRNEISRRRLWFVLLREYCQAKNDALNALRKSPHDGAAAAAGTRTRAGAAQETPVPEKETQFEELDRGVRQKLESLGLERWAFARSVVLDTTDLAMAGERLNQIVAQLAAMDARESFLDEMVDPVLEMPESEGLNRKHDWLRLPVCILNGNLWAGGYFTLTSLHMLLVLLVAVLSLCVLLLRFDAARGARWRTAERWWYATTVIGVAIFLLFYAT